ncbi:MAG: hypothetical protein L3J57_04985 [Desulfuromusa sp.]|nr:hypothetical protein [Desulfuromusa sp.]
MLISKLKSTDSQGTICLVDIERAISRTVREEVPHVSVESKKQPISRLECARQSLRQ